MFVDGMIGERSSFKLGTYFGGFSARKFTVNI